MSHHSIIKSLIVAILVAHFGCTRSPDATSTVAPSSDPPTKNGKREQSPRAQQPLRIVAPGDATRIQWSTALVDPQQLAKAIRLATTYLEGVCDESGQFTYCVHVDPTRKINPEYNILRHAGTLYALQMAYERSPEESTRRVLLRAATFLQDRAVAPLDGKPHLLAVWSRPELNHSDQPAQAKLGGAGLGLVALGGMEQIQPGFSRLTERRGLASFICFMQRDDGSFYSKYFPNTGPDATWTSLYYPGEAALGLLNLYAQDPDERWLHAAAAAMSFLASSQQQSPSVRPDHWMLLAASKLVPLFERCETRVTRTELIQHIHRTCKRMADDQRPFLSKPLLRGCFVEDGRTTPTSIRLEGLIAALEILDEEDPRLGQRIEKVVTYGIQFLLRCQVRDGRYRGGIPCAIRFIPTGDEEDDIELRRRAGEIRIDYVQHALSAMIQYEQRITRHRGNPRR